MAASLTRSIAVRALALAAACALLFALGAARTQPAVPLVVATATAAPNAEPTASTGRIATAALPLARFAVASTGGTAAVTLPIEAPPEREYAIGLSGRGSLAGRGMLFAFPEGTTTPFWMKGTHIDLDIAFVDASMRVIDVQTMRAETLDHHQPTGVYVAAIEAPAGWYAEHGVKPGAQVTLDIDLKTAAGR